MLPNSDFYALLKTTRTTFQLADLHVHSPASADVRTGERLASLDAGLKTALETIPVAVAKDPVRYEEEVLAVIPPADFLKSLVAQRDRVAGGDEGTLETDWALVAITDHNVCRYATKLASLAFQQRSLTRLVVLPGIELDVQYPCPNATGPAAIHVLCIYRPGTSESDIRVAIDEASSTSWSFGETLQVASLADFVCRLRAHAAYPAICIAAHVSSAKGIQNETKTTIFSNIDAEISRIEGELQRVEDDGSASAASDRAILSSRIEKLKGGRSSGGIALDVLRLIGQCGFDALQLAAPGDGTHYRRLHRFREGHGRAVPIVASDAHRPESVFGTMDDAPFLKLPSLASSFSETAVFEAVRKSLRYGETRFSTARALPPQYWISGVEITPDASDAAQFWPVGGAAPLPCSPGSFVLPLSRNLNTLIGGRGSGKSAAIEAIAFVAEPSSFAGVKPRREDRTDSYNRAEATLSGCRVRLCWQFVGDGDLSHLQKKAIFAQRYFDTAHRHLAVEYTNLQGQQLVPEQIPLHNVQIFRLGDIERQSGPTRLRALFDQICGVEIVHRDKRILDLTADLRLQRTAMLKIAQRIRDLTGEESVLRKYVERRKLLTGVDTPEMKAAYDEIDQIETAQSVVNETRTEWSSTVSAKELEAKEHAVSEFIDNAVATVTAEDGSTKPRLDPLASLLAAGYSVESPSLARGIAPKLQALALDVEAVDQKLETMSSALAAEITAAKERLTTKGLPSGSKDREAKKRAFRECDEALTRYRCAMKEWDEALTLRDQTRTLLLNECAARSSLRKRTAQQITTALERDIDSGILAIEADAQAERDWSLFRKWLEANFSGQDFKFKEDRIQALLDGGLRPDALRAALLDVRDPDPSLLLVKRSSARDGGIEENVALALLRKCRARAPHALEVERDSVSPEFWATLPDEIRAGLAWFPGEHGPSCLDQALQLDEITFDDVPVIRLNDRPNDPGAVARPIEELSPGQRCSAILPILLLTGSGPLIIDQPEDNLDNRLIRQVIVNILASIKLRRQVIMATHNPNIPVLGDVEAAVVLQGVGDRKCQVAAAGDLDSPRLSSQLTDVMEGGREAFQYRHTIYNEHWKGPVAELE